MGRPKKPDAELKTPRNPNVKPPPKPVAVEKPLRADSPLSDFEPMFVELESSASGLCHLTAKYGMHRPTFLLWCRQRPELQARLDVAKENQIDFMEEETQSIVDDGSNDWMERLAFNGGNPGWEVNGENIKRSELRFRERQWRLAHLRPKKWSDKLQVSGEFTVDSTIRRQAQTLADLPPELLAQIEQAFLTANAKPSESADHA